MDIVMVYFQYCAVQILIRTIVDCSRLQLRHAILPQVLLLGQDKILGGLLEDNREILEEHKDFKLTVAIEQ